MAVWRMYLEWKGERTDYLCEMKFREHVFTIDKKYELELASKIEALRQSKCELPLFRTVCN